MKRKVGSSDSEHATESRQDRKQHVTDYETHHRYDEAGVIFETTFPVEPEHFPGLVAEVIRHMREFRIDGHTQIEDHDIQIFEGQTLLGDVPIQEFATDNPLITELQAELVGIPTQREMSPLEYDEPLDVTLSLAGTPIERTQLFATAVQDRTRDEPILVPIVGPLMTLTGRQLRSHNICGIEVVPPEHNRLTLRVTGSIIPEGLGYDGAELLEKTASLILQLEREQFENAPGIVRTTSPIHIAEDEDDILTILSSEIPIGDPYPVLRLAQNMATYPIPFGRELVEQEAAVIVRRLGEEFSCQIDTLYLSLSVEETHDGQNPKIAARVSAPEGQHQKTFHNITEAVTRAVAIYNDAAADSPHIFMHPEQEALNQEPEEGAQKPVDILTLSFSGVDPISIEELRDALIQILSYTPAQIISPGVSDRRVFTRLIHAIHTAIHPEDSY